MQALAELRDTIVRRAVLVRVADCRWVTSSEFEKYRFPAADQATMDLLLGIKR